MILNIVLYTCNIHYIHTILCYVHAISCYFGPADSIVHNKIDYVTLFTNFLNSDIYNQDNLWHPLQSYVHDHLWWSEPCTGNLWNVGFYISCCLWPRFHILVHYSDCHHIDEVKKYELWMETCESHVYGGNSNVYLLDDVKSKFTLNSKSLMSPDTCLSMNWQDTTFNKFLASRYLEYFPRNYPQVKAMGFYWWLLNIGSGNGLMHQATSHYLRQCWPRSVTIWCH